MNLHLEMYNFVFLDSVGNTDKCMSLAEFTFDSSLNATTTTQIVRFLFTDMHKCFLSYDFISG